MKTPFRDFRRTALLLRCLVFLGLAGCGKSGTDVADAVPRHPGEAASQLEQVFISAPADVRQKADAAAQALRQGDYERAVVALQVLRGAPKITMEQGVAIHHSLVAMESRLISAADSGDPNAQRAYELLKALKRK